MEVIGVIKGISEPRYFQGRDGNVKVVDVLIQSGDDAIIAGAVDRQADAFTMQDTPLQVNALVKANVACSVNEGEKGHFQQMRLRSIGVIMAPCTF